MSSSKSRKSSKKKIKTTISGDGTKLKDNSACKIYAYFTNEETAEIKAILKVKDITGVPLVIAATVLHKFQVLKIIVKDEHNINQTGQNNMTALTWAVKLKFLNFVDFLLENGADPTMKTDNGDNILIMALENKLWDEESFINLWKTVKKKSFIDVNFTNKNGHNMLHMCVRREWEQVLHLLLAEKPNVDDANFNGVTPLMLACFRTNHNIVNILIKAGANVLKKDNHGRMPVCYVISSSMKAKPPFLAMERVLSELSKKSSFEQYLKDTIELVITTAKKPEISTSTSEMLIKIIQFAVQYNNGTKLFLDTDIFPKFREVIKTQLTNLESVKFILEICIEIFFYNDESNFFDSKLLQAVQANFYDNSLVDLCLEILYLNNSKTAKVAFNLLLLTFHDTDKWKKIIEANYRILSEYTHFSEDIIQEDHRIKFIEDQKEKLKKSLEKFSKSDQNERRSSDSCKNVKKSRRRSKAIKAKLSKLKTAELSKRLNLSGRKSLQQKSSKTDSSLNENDSSDKISIEQNPIVASLQHLLTKPQIKTTPRKTCQSPSDWKHEIWNTNANFKEYCPINVEGVEEIIHSVQGDKNKLDSESINIIIAYLRNVLQFLIKKYRQHWSKDKTTGSCDCYGALTNILWTCNCNLGNVTETERQTLHDLEANFENLQKNIKALSGKNLKRSVKLINEIEATILQHEIRKIKMLTYATIREPFTLKYTNTNRSEDDVVKHISNVLNRSQEENPELSLELVDNVDEDVEFLEEYTPELPMDMYHREMSMLSAREPKNKRKEIESKLNTIANGFHLINSTMALCEDSDDENDASDKRLYSISDLNYPITANKTEYKPDHPFKELSRCVPKRLRSQIASLQNAKSFQSLLDGDIRISVKEQRVNYIVSAGINFNAVDLGLDLNNQPLAVKRIQRQSWVGKIMKTLVDPLLGLSDKHILPYFACEYEGDELILATPLCKWNMAQYMQLLRQSNVTSLPSSTSNEIIKQFLDGLMVLHKCEIPIVHGNLKPSNVFIDFNGVVKIAEFGIHKTVSPVQALYKIIEPPKSSLIWFAKETLESYRNSSIVDCSIRSDIQVAGMFIYFVLTYGKHPFGDDTEEILKNIQSGLSKLKVRNYELREMLLWMMQNDSHGRPDIEQVVAHPFFWAPAKKWNFILCCSGSNQTGFLLPINISKLYRSIDTFSDAYIKVDWQEIVRNKIPGVKLNDHKGISGLLRFIKYCYDNQVEAQISESELSSSILSFFPTLPVVLYRTLQNTNWLKHAIFTQFSDIF